MEKSKAVGTWEPHCCRVIQHPTSWSQNQKPGCSLTAAHIPSLHFDSGSRFIKWSGAQNRVCIAKFENLLVNFIWTSYYDDFILVCRKGDEENTASALKTWVPVVCIVKCTPFISPMCEGSAICSTRVATQISLHKVKSSLRLCNSRSSNPCSFFQTSRKLRNSFVRNGTMF